MKLNQLATLAVWSVVASAAGCGVRRDAAAPTLTVAAASDLQGAFREIGKSFEGRAGCQVVMTFGSSGQLAQQIEHGAPFDVFAAANVAYVQQLVDKKKAVADSMQVYARGRIVLITRKNSGAAAVRLEDLLHESIKHIAIANPAHAPYGQAAKQAIEHRELWDRLQPKLVLAENVRQALQYVETGNADAGIVAHSVAAVPDVVSTPIDAAWHKPLDQAIVVVSDSKNVGLARQFIGLVIGPDGQAVLERHGFEKPERPVEHEPQ
jgi:molybdate transport system substrate-binding protein